MSCHEFVKDPLDKRIINIRFATWLGATPTILGVAWVVPAGLTESDDSFTDTVATNYFSGGSLDEEYEVACTITTNESPARDKTQRFAMRVEKCG